MRWVVFSFYTPNCSQWANALRCNLDPTAGAVFAHALKMATIKTTFNPDRSPRRNRAPHPIETPA